MTVDRKRRPSPLVEHAREILSTAYPLDRVGDERIGELLGELKGELDRRVKAAGQIG